MLYGGYDHSIDKKGRIAIPAKLRSELGENFMICCGIYGKRCLCVYSMSAWEELVEKIAQLPNAQSSVLKRFLYGGSTNVEFDSQGRILIPAALREYAKLGSEAHIIGVDTNLEIWSMELWEEEKVAYTPEAIAEVSMGLNF